jgi:uncharacterized membrane protein YqjE
LATESPTHDLAKTVQDISERVATLVHEEIELATAEVTEKVTKLLKGIVVGISAGIFVIVGGLFFFHGLAWLAWFALPGDSPVFFWGFFILAGLLFVLGGVAGFLAARFLKDSTPPVPEMAIDEAGKIKRMFRKRR